MCGLWNDSAACFQAVKTKRPHASFKQPHKPSVTVFLKRIAFSVKLKTECFANLEFFHCSILVFFFLQISVNFSNYPLLILQNCGCFPLKFCAGNWRAVGQN